MQHQARDGTPTATLRHLRPVAPGGRPPLAPRSPAKGPQQQQQQQQQRDRTPSHSTSSCEDTEDLILPLPDAAVRLEPEPPAPRHPATRVVKVPTDDPSSLETEWIRGRVAKLRLAMSQVSEGTIAHARLLAQRDRLLNELAKRGEPLQP